MILIALLYSQHKFKHKSFPTRNAGDPHFVKELDLVNNDIIAAYSSESSLKETTAYLKSNNAVWRKVNLLNTIELEEIIQDMDLVIHCAAKVSFDKREYRTMYNFNKNSTGIIVDLCNLHRKKLIYISSVATLGGGLNITEQTPWTNTDNTTGYAKSKYAAECEFFRAVEEGLKGVIVNPTIILGQGTLKKGSGALMKTLLKGIPFYPPGSNGFTLVEDVVKASLFLLEKQCWNERYLLVNTNASWRNLFSLFATLTHNKAPKIKLNSTLIWMAILFDSLKGRLGFRRRITQETGFKSFEHSSYSSKKITELGFQFLDFEEMTEKYVSDLR